MTDILVTASRKLFGFRAVNVSLENLSRDFYCRTTVESKLFDCPFRVAAPLSGDRSCPVPLKSQLCECLAAKKGATFLAFRSKTDPSSDSQWTRNESLGLLLSASPSLFLPACVFSRLPYCRGREVLPKAIFIRKAIQMPKNAQSRYTRLACVSLRVGDTCANQAECIKGCMCFMDHTY